jgi:hypothetical protein
MICVIEIDKALKPTKNQQITESQLLIELAPNGLRYSIQLLSGAVAATYMTSAGHLAKARKCFV